MAKPDKTWLSTIDNGKSLRIPFIMWVVWISL